MLLSYLQLSSTRMMRVLIRYEIPWGVDDSTITQDLLEPLLVHPNIYSFEKDRLRMRIHVIVKVHPRELHTIRLILVSTFSVSFDITGGKRSIAKPALDITLESMNYSPYMKCFCSNIAPSLTPMSSSATFYPACSEGHLIRGEGLRSTHISII